MLEKLHLIPKAYSVAPIANAGVVAFGLLTFVSVLQGVCNSNLFFFLLQLCDDVMCGNNGA